MNALAGWRITTLTAAEYRAMSARQRGQPLLQSVFWGALKSTVGWQAHYCVVSHSRYPSFPLLALAKRLPLGSALVYGAHAPPALSEVMDAEEYWAFLSSLSAAYVRDCAARLADARRARNAPRGAAPLIIRWDVPRIDPPPAAIAAPRPSLSADAASGTAPDTASDTAAASASGTAPDVAAASHTTAASAPDAAAAPDAVSGVVPTARLLRAPHSIQPRHTIIIDLCPPAEAILAQMKSKTRYNIRLAERKGVTVRIDIAARASDVVPDAVSDTAARSSDAAIASVAASASNATSAPAASEAVPNLPAALRRWYALYQQTCARNRIGQRPLRYFQTIFRLGRAAESDTRVELLCAEYHGTLLGGIIVAYHSGVATYLFGASSNTMRNLMANYLLQWRAMLRAKEFGCERYDLFGIAPGARGHYLSGLYRFKSGFGGALIERWGSIDHIVAPLLARIYRCAERARFLYHRRIKKRRGH